MGTVELRFVKCIKHEVINLVGANHYAPCPHCEKGKDNFYPTHFKFRRVTFACKHCGKEYVIECTHYNKIIGG